jgi:transcriptional regulator
MYDLPYYKENDTQIIQEFIAKYPFAFVTGSDIYNKPVASQVPVFIEEIDGRKVLRGHIMKHTDHHKAFVHNPHVLIVFTGHSTYVSGTWYTNPSTPSTWNYMSVHVQGSIKFLEGNELIDILRKTTLHFEEQNQQSATIYDNLPVEITKRLMQAIVGFEIEITKIETVFKLSQDRDLLSYENIIEKLTGQGENGQAIAIEMEKRKSDVFSSKK